MTPERGNQIAGMIEMWLRTHKDEPGIDSDEGAPDYRQQWAWVAYDIGITPGELAEWRKLTRQMSAHEGNHTTTDDEGMTHAIMADFILKAHRKK